VSELLVVSPTFHPEKVGTPHYVTDLVRGLSEAGEQVRVVTSQPYYPAFERFDGYGRGTRRDEVDGVPVYRVPTVVPRGGQGRWRAVSEVNFLLQVVFAVVTGRVARSSRVLAVSPGVPFAVIAGWLLRRRGGRLVTVVHDIQFGLVASTRGGLGRIAARLARRVEVWALNRSDVVTVLSPAMASELRAAGVSAPIEVVALWPTIEPAADGSEEPGVVLYSGNLGAKQGVGRLLEMAGYLFGQVPEARVVIRGQGPERAELEAEAVRRGLDNVEFVDFVEASDLPSELARAAVHVVPQLPAGAAHAVPSKIYNALAVGRPVVVTAAAGSPVAEMAADCPALVCVDPDDDEALGAAVAKLLEDDVLRRDLGAQGRAWVEANCSKEAVVTRYRALLDSTPAVDTRRQGRRDAR